MKNSRLLRIFIAVGLLNLTACSYIQSLFPDKERDYQFTTEIAPLTLPTDLNSAAKSSVPAAPVADAQQAEQSPETEPVNEPSEAEPTVEHEAIQVELVKAEQGENRLRIAAPMAQAWRIVGKALSRKSLEVIKRNQDEKSFTVQYDPNEQKVVDETFWDELDFIFGGLGNDDKEYLIELLDTDEKVTEVTVTDQEQHSSVGADAGFRLLTLIRDTIKADLAIK